MISNGHNFVAFAGGSGDGDSVGLSRANIGIKWAKIEINVADAKRKFFKSVVDVLETGFDGVTVAVEAARGVLADSVSELEIIWGFFTAGHIKVTPVDVISGGIESLGKWDCRL